MVVESIVFGDGRGRLKVGQALLLCLAGVEWLTCVFCAALRCLCGQR